MENPILYIPIATTVLSAWFAWVVFQRFRQKEWAWHLAWWSGGKMRSMQKPGQHGTMVG